MYMKPTPYSREPKEGGILRGLPAIAEYCGCAEQTILIWFHKNDFPLGKLPNREWVTTVTLIDTWIHARGVLWLRSRRRPRNPKGDGKIQEAIASVEKTDDG
jgi:hypothetical protein